MPNVKNAARDVRAVCKAMPRNAFNTLKKNRNGNRNSQWSDVERQFKTDCDMAQRIILTPSPQNSLLQQIDPVYTEDVYQRAMENIGKPASCLPLKSFTPHCANGSKAPEPEYLSPINGQPIQRFPGMRKGRKSRKSRKSRKNRR